MMNLLTKKNHQFKVYLFEHPEALPVQVHQSHICDKTLWISRIICWIYLSGIYVWSLSVMPSILSNVIYMTMIGYFLTWCYYTMIMQDYLLHYKFNFGSTSPSFKNTIHLIYEIALTAQLPITVIFWGFLYSELINDDSVTAATIAVNANLHAGPLVCLLIDLSLNSYHFHWRHFTVILICSAFYMLINLIYSLTVKVIYPPIDWVSVLSYVILLFSLILTTLMFFLAQILYKIWKTKKLKYLEQQILLSNTNHASNNQSKNQENEDIHKDEIGIN